jgi:hypothetical protein
MTVHIGGHPDSVDELPDIPPPKPDGMVELVTQEQIKTIDAGEIEYEC